MKMFLQILQILSIVTCFSAGASDLPIWKDRFLNSVYRIRTAIVIGDISTETKKTLDSIINGWWLRNTSIEAITPEQSRALADVLLVNETSKNGVLFLGHCHWVPSVFVTEEELQEDRRGRRGLIWNALKSVLGDEALLARCVQSAVGEDGKVNPFGFPKFSPDMITRLDEAIGR